MLPQEPMDENRHEAPTALSGILRDQADLLIIVDSLAMIERACKRVRGVLTRRYSELAPVPHEPAREHPHAEASSSEASCTSCRD